MQTPRIHRRSRSDRVARGPRAEWRAFQIGPKIRVGGSIGHAAQKLKLGAGKVLSNPLVDTALSFVPGVGPGMAAAARGVGTALDTSRGSVGVGDILKNTAEQYGINKFAGGLKDAAGNLLHGPGSFMDRVGGLGHTLAKGVGLGGGGAGNGMPGAENGMPGGMPGGQGGGGGGMGNLFKDGLLAAAVAQAAEDRAQQAHYIGQAADASTGAYNARAPLRQRAIGALSSDIAAPNLSSIFGDPGNAYGKPRPPQPPGV